jgi:hypothetical protein
MGTVNNLIPVSMSNTGMWLHLQGDINQVDAMNYEGRIAIGFPLANPSSEGFSGTMYVDDVRLIAP